MISVKTVETSDSKRFEDQCNDLLAQGFSLKCSSCAASDTKIPGNGVDVLYCAILVKGDDNA